MAKKIIITGGKKCSVILQAHHKKNGSVVMTIFPAVYDLKSRTLVDPRVTNGLIPLQKIRFESIQAVDNFMTFIHMMRDRMIYNTGHANGRLAMQSEIMQRELEAGIIEEVSIRQQKTTPQSVDK